MESLFFLGEQVQNGLIFRLGTNTADGCWLHWEPMAVKLKGNESIVFRESLKERSRAFLKNQTPAGILSIAGPVAFQGKIWLGWEARTGKSIFQLEGDQKSLRQRIRGCAPLIHSYLDCHRLGLIAGRPDWGRFFYDEAGFFTPDPFAGSFLSSSPCNPPQGFTACHPPEIYRGERYTRQSDLFYLGLILYFAITGKLPFRLMKGWPNKSLMAGVVIPPTFHCPELNPRLSETIVHLLAGNPGQRPSAHKVAEVWDGIMETGDYEVSKPEAIRQFQSSRKALGKQRRERMKRALKVHFRKPWVMVAGIVVFSVMIWGWIGSQPTPSPESEALRFARSFYEKAAVMYSPVMGNPAEEPVGLMKDFDLARKERLKIVSEVLSRPLARVKSMKILETDSRQCKIEACLTWWFWNGAGWERSEQVEMLALEKVKKTWRVKERIK